MLHHHNNCIISLDRKIRKFSGSPLQVVVQKAQQTHLSTISVMSLEVRRAYLLADAMREAQKGKFDPTKMAKVYDAD